MTNGSATRWPPATDSTSRARRWARRCRRRRRAGRRPRPARRCRCVNRHGLIAGATGTGKTKTLQMLAGELSEAGVPVFVADVKGDLIGRRRRPATADPKVVEPAKSLGWTFAPKAHPVEFLSLSGQARRPGPGDRPALRAAAAGQGAGPQRDPDGVLSLVFQYCDDNDLPLLDLADLRTTLKFLGSDEGKPVLDDYGGMSPATLGVILRSIVDARAGGRRRLLRRARVRRPGPDAHDARRQGHRQRCSSSRT